MRKTVIYAVELQDPSDFSFLPGAREFRSRYAAQEKEYPYFYFDLDRDDTASVEKELQSSRLPYSKHYELSLEEEELAGHPVCYLSIPAFYDLVAGNNEELAISSEINSEPIAKDFGTEALVARHEVVELLSRLNPNIKAAQDRVFTVKRRKYRILGDLPQLEDPVLIRNATAVRENEDEYKGTYYPHGWDGRSSLSERAVEFVRREHLAAAWYFDYGKQRYKYNVPDYLMSGEFAAFLRRKFKEKAQITPMTFDLI